MPAPFHAMYLMDEEVLPLVYGPNERAALAQLITFVRPALSARTLDAYQGSLQHVQAIFSGWGMPPVDDALLKRLPACEIVFHAGGTVRPFATPAMWRRRIRLTTAADANAIPVAEYTLAAIIFSLKHVWARLAESRNHHIPLRDDPLVPGVFGSTVGLLSLSRIGRKVAQRLQAHDLSVIAYDPVIDPEIAAGLRVRLCSLDEVFACSDVVSCHLPLLPQTTEVLRRRHFASMRLGASFINTARGRVVNEAELLSVLRDRPDLQAVLDVAQQEPVPVGSPLLNQANLVVTPHIAGSRGPECRRLGRMMVEEARRYLAREPLAGEVFHDQMAFMA